MRQPRLLRDAHADDEWIQRRIPRAAGDLIDHGGQGAGWSQSLNRRRWRRRSRSPPGPAGESRCQRPLPTRLATRNAGAGTTGATCGRGRCQTQRGSDGAAPTEQTACQWFAARGLGVTLAGASSCAGSSDSCGARRRARMPRTIRLSPGESGRHRSDRGGRPFTTIAADAGVRARPPARP